ncbi:Glycoside hydrolase family 5 protein [Mycena sanguinolenta]|uniref:glucan 1,3-beta-glucosidase n=1 Tax=Mycena sanguinolenta TaxID=230812 RepID=A0A8H7DMZ5_9AGAR|nr:Glycoside hydrolase family 5 protein [Mycena sanguinolenta]
MQERDARPFFPSTATSGSTSSYAPSPIYAIPASPFTPGGAPSMHPVPLPPASPLFYPTAPPPVVPSLSGSSESAGPVRPGSIYTGAYAGAGSVVRRQTKKRRRRIAGGIATLVVVALAVVLPVYFLVVKKRHSSRANDGGSGSAGGGSGGRTGPISGGDGSTVTTEAGDTFVYQNPFGGYWLLDSTAPFSPSSAGRPNSWTPLLNETWDWGQDRIYGVNLGGWFVLEPFITPALFQAYPSAADEWTLSALMQQDGTLQATMEAHYDTFVTERDFAEITAAGLNWVRVPIPFWAVSTWSNVGTDSTGAIVAEPFLEGVCWKYIIRMLGWARKYGLRVNLDIHTAPGSQNGYNHSGRLGPVNFLNGVMGIANAQRMLDYIRIIIEFVTQPEWSSVVLMVGIINEALLTTIGREQLSAFYLQSHSLIRNITGLGAGNGPFISIHDGFDGLPPWAGFLEGSDRIILDTHPYFAFDQQPNTAPIATGTGEDGVTAGGIWPAQACNVWGPSINTSRAAFGVTVAGEFSTGYNDCGLYLTGVNGTHSYGGDCTLWEDASTWNQTVVAGLREYTLASMDAMRDWFFWTWKIGNATDGVVRSPLWSYQLGLQNGWVPTDPRTALGTCAELGVSGPQFVGTFSAWQTGGAGAGTIAPSAIAEFGVWPPATISNVAAAASVLPTYTPTGSVTTLVYTTPAPSTVTATASVSAGDGWFDAGDTALAMTAVAGCTYPNAWDAVSTAVPAVCTGVP